MNRVKDLFIKNYNESAVYKKRPRYIIMIKGRIALRF